MLQVSESIIADTLKWLSCPSELLSDSPDHKYERGACLELVMRQYSELLASFGTIKIVGNPISQHQRRGSVPNVASSTSATFFLNNIGIKYRGLYIALNGIYTVLLGNGSAESSRSMILG